MNDALCSGTTVSSNGKVAELDEGLRVRAEGHRIGRVRQVPVAIGAFDPRGDLNIRPGRVVEIDDGETVAHEHGPGDIVGVVEIRLALLVARRARNNVDLHCGLLSLAWYEASG